MHRYRGAAPSGGNQGSRRWIIVQDQEIKDRIAEIYMESAGQWMIASYEKLEGTGHPQEKVMASAAHLAQHLSEVPAIVIPTIIGVHDGSGRPGLFDSVIQSTWSFVLPCALAASDQHGQPQYCLVETTSPNCWEFLKG